MRDRKLRFDAYLLEDFETSCVPPISYGLKLLQPDVTGSGTAAISSRIWQRGCSLAPSTAQHLSFQLHVPAASAHKHRHMIAPAATKLSTLTNSDSTAWELSKIAVGAQLLPTITR